MPTRYLRPGIRDSETIDALTPLAETLFYRLLVTVDDFGRADARPAMIKAHCFPIKATITAEQAGELLLELAASGLVLLFTVDGKQFLQMQKWENAPRAKESKFPSHEDARAQMHTHVCKPRTLLPVTVTGTGTGTDNREPVTENREPGLHVVEVRANAQTPLQAICRDTWESYAAAYADRYHTPPIRNAKVNSLIKRFCQMVPASEAASIAAHYVRHNGQYYVAKLHPVDLLLLDAAKLRTEWATGVRMTATRARQIDQTGSMMDMVAEIKRERGEA